MEQQDTTKTQQSEGREPEIDAIADFYAGCASLAGMSVGEWLALETF